MGPGVRRFVLVSHLTFSMGWVGAALAYLGLAISVMKKDPTTVRAAWIAMEITGWYVLVPLAVGSLVSGVAQSLGTRWGLFQHYWVVTSLVLTAIAVGVLLLHMPGVSATAAVARDASDADLIALGSDLAHPGLGVLLLLLVATLNVYKPRGLTRYGWRKAQREAKALRP